MLTVSSSLVALLVFFFLVVVEVVGVVVLLLMAPMAGVLAGVLPGLGITWLAVSEIGKGGT